MEKKKTKRPPANTHDIRSFFGMKLSPADENKQKSNVPSTNEPVKVVSNESVKPKSKESRRLSHSSTDESPVKKVDSKKKSSDKMSSKRKKSIYLESTSESEEEVVRAKKKTKKEAPSKKSRKLDSESDDDFVPESKSKNKKLTTTSTDKKMPAKKSPAKKEATSKKVAASKKATKEKKTTSSKGKLVKPMDYESENEEDHIKPTFVKQLPKVSGIHSNCAPSNKTANDQERSEMWVDKYKPKRVSDVIGQHTPKCPATKLKDWLMDWEANKNEKPRFFGKNDTGVGLKAALLSGCPGIGKTTTAQLVAKECGYDFIEYNASDTRNKKSLDDFVQTLIGNKSLSSYVQDSKNQTEMTSRHLLIMDEVDGMGGNADRGGIAELIQFIKKTKIPIICICNERNDQKIRNLANYCFDLRFGKPRKDLIKKLVKDICSRESIKVADNLLEEVIEMSNSDIRQVIHYVSVFGTKTKMLSDVKSNKIIKNVTLGPFDATLKAFKASPENDAMTFKDRSDIFFNDYQLLPLMAFENYIHCKPDKSSNATETLSRVAKSIDAMCIGDIISNEIRSKQSWNLLPMQACFSLVIPSLLMNGHFGDQIQFPSYLGKLSSTNKKERLVNELKQHMNLKITGSKTCLNLDYILPLRERLIRPLLRKDEDSVPNAINTLIHYCLLKDDLDSIIELSLWKNEKNPYSDVDTKTKAAFTRSFNGSSWTMPYAFKDMWKKVAKGSSKDTKAKKGKNDDEDQQDEGPTADDFLIPEF